MLSPHETSAHLIVAAIADHHPRTILETAEKAGLTYDQTVGGLDYCVTHRLVHTIPAVKPTRYVLSSRLSSPDAKAL